MLIGLFIFTDIEFNSPLYADPHPGLVGWELYYAVCGQIFGVINGDWDVNYSAKFGDQRLVWRHNTQYGLNFAAVIDVELCAADCQSYLTELCRRYVDEMDEAGDLSVKDVAIIVVDVVPPWEARRSSVAKA